MATSSEGTRTETLPLARQGRGLTQQELESRLWAAANSLRGPVDPADFKSYVFPLLFFKWASDTWDLEHAAAIAGFGGDLTAEIEADFHRFTMPRGCHWSDLQKVSANVGVALQKILDRLAEANPGPWPGSSAMSPGVTRSASRPSLLNLIDAFDRLTLNRTVVSNDMLGAATNICSASSPTSRARRRESSSRRGA